MKKYMYLLWILLTCCHCLVAAAVTQIKVGVLGLTNYGGPYDIERIGPGIQMAFDRINDDYLNDSYKLVKMERHYGSLCALKNDAPGIAADLYYNASIVALIGPGCAFALDPTARLAGYWNIPLVTGLGDGGSFKNRTNYPTMTRFAYCQCRLRKVFGSVLENFNWTDVVLIYDLNDVSSNVLGGTLQVGLQKQKIYPYLIPYYGNEGRNLSDILQEGSAKGRVMILVAPGDVVRQFMISAYDLGYIQTGEYVFMDVVLFPFKGNYWGDHDWYRGDNSDVKAKTAYEAMFRISLHQPNGSEWHAFSEKVKKKAKTEYNFDYGDEKVNFFVGAYYDAVLLYGIGLSEALQKGIDYTNGYNFSRNVLWDRTFTGITEKVIIDANGDRDTSYAILDMNPVTGEFEVVANYWGDRPQYNPVPGAVIHWAGGRQTPPLNIPRCGFTGDDPICEEAAGMSVEMVAAIATFGSILICLIVGFLIYRRVKWEIELKTMAWRIVYDDIKLQSMAARSSVLTLSYDGKSGVLENQTFTTVGTYKGNIVAVKKSDKKSIHLTRAVLTELKMTRELQHDNLVRFVGACVDPPDICIITEYCKKGSLADVLAQDNIDLDWGFKLSLMQDLLKGMVYLHSSLVKSHGHLTSSNCVIDGRFVLKLTDYGLHSFRGEAKGDWDESGTFDKSLLWRAPEHLRDTMPPMGSPKGDSYSFGIILEEIIHRSGPFDHASTTMNSEDIVQKVRSLASPPFRPQIKDDTGTSPVVIELAQRCWAENPADRPDFGEVTTTLKKMNKGKEKNIMDTLLNRMEQYATNLESIVEERTTELVFEKKKSEELLHQILPKSIAEQLKQGKVVVPEEFECVTIYFSDIVGFTSLSSGSTPFQVVELLNDLYTCFDAVIDSFNVYKVETIGDAYMVVSGLPIRNGDAHASEIARMSLGILDEIQTFKVKHRPGYHMEVRIGLHSGSCVAGVVGLKMPRYCLFGDTVNTASRMESNSLPLKIHMSASTTKLLEKGGDFHIEPRGEIEIKGKGMMRTSWLLENTLESVT